MPVQSCPRPPPPKSEPRKSRALLTPAVASASETMRWSHSLSWLVPHFHTTSMRREYVELEAALAVIGLPGFSPRTRRNRNGIAMVRCRPHAVCLLIRILPTPLTFDWEVGHDECSGRHPLFNKVRPSTLSSPNQASESDRKSFAPALTDQEVPRAGSWVGMAGSDALHVLHCSHCAPQRAD